MFYSSADFQRNLDTGASTARSEAASARSEVAALSLEVERLLMITEALWTILQEKHGFDDDELVRRIVMIDMRDGKLDGKVAPTAPSKCPKCERTLFKHRPRCLYCGEPIALDPFAR